MILYSVPEYARFTCTMAELKERLDDEEKLLAALLLIFSQEDLAFWLSGKATPYWFLDRIQESKIRSTVDSVVFRSAKGMLREIKVDIGDLDEAIRKADGIVPDAAKVTIDLPGDDTPVDDPTPDEDVRRQQPYEPGADNRYRDGLLERLRVIAQQYELELAARLHRHYADWTEKAKTAQDEGESVDPVVYPQHRAKAEAVTATTGFISQAQLIAAAFVRGFLHVTVHAKWSTELDGRQCPVCNALHDTWQGTWMIQFPQGPPSHVLCRCALFFYREVDNDSRSER